ncbi:diguanylate cyclase [Rhodospirillum sp. A1_3_36]|uniref:GGDEF domain-containing protein n=1 Tax=Rhodospirillum sp. A1_3_36 TaxID=3391666 RepID=UPI0039A61567
MYDLVLPLGHSPLVQRRRAILIISRVRWVAMTFAVLTPLWIAVDMVMFPWPLSGILTALRVGATVTFGSIALGFRNTERMRSAMTALALLLAIPCLFFIISVPSLANFDLTAIQQVFASGYAFLPFVMVAGLAVFPITFVEGVALTAPLILSQFGVAILGFPLEPFNYYLGALWLLALLAIVATLAGMSQLHFMTQLVNQAAHDGLTKVYTRRVGEELLDVQFNSSQRSGLPLSIAFLDLDHFKSVNDRFGHEEGDKTLKRACESLRKVLRRGDIVVRWGGEEFIIMMPNTTGVGALNAILRLRELGLGNRPDGEPQTASIGVAEMVADESADWSELVELADKRMYKAKKSGRDRVVTLNEEMITDSAPMTVAAS